MAGIGGRAVRSALGTILAGSAGPYGYTISIWSAGAVLLSVHGIPNMADIWAFVVGGLVGFGLMAWLAREPLAPTELVDHPRARVLAGAMNWFAVGAAVGAAALIAEVHGILAWSLASFAATTVYILSASAQLVWVSGRHPQPAGRRPAAEQRADGRQPASDWLEFL